LTKRLAEDTAEYLSEMGIRVKYLHSEIAPIDRVEILRELRLGKFDCLVGINLLREGLDLPEVSLVAILDGDKEGFLRDARSLIQTAGRAARNVRGEVIIYADNITTSIKKALEETERRRQKQIEYNRKHNIIPRSIEKSQEQVLKTTVVADAKGDYNQEIEEITEEDKIKLLEILTAEMKRAAENMEFEKAAKIRDKIKEIKEELSDETLKFLHRKKKRR
jgi:excinuclease ABC subunit B